MQKMNYLVTYVHGSIKGMYGLAAASPEQAVERTEQFVKGCMPVFHPEQFTITKVEALSEEDNDALTR